ncbi:MAG: hypothetical protein D6814_08285 [Calditrichaeota bacterium]|nr:MAG: hypothetical protein D6814_08285 [Calditrichota bacterium]
MQTGKAVTAGLVGGVVLAVYEFIIHGLILGGTYAARAEVFRQDAPMFWFPIIAILMGIAAGLFFGKSRSAWAEGAKGGVSFGFWVGLLAFLAAFYNPLVFNGFPYFMSWVWGIVNWVGWLIVGAIFGAMYKPAAA